MLELLMMCAPAVDPVTMAAVVKQESGGQPWVINNNSTKKSTVFDSKAAAVAAALEAVRLGQSVDLGLAQINSKNLAGLGLSVDQVFDPCTNLAAGARILTAGYEKSGSLLGAFSTYNTGRSDSKVGSAYAQKVFGQAGIKVPGIPGGQLPSFSFAPPRPAALPPVRLAVTPTPASSGLSPAAAPQALKPGAWR